ncbi:hypothetical protein AHAS_Ahas11G0188200 [Arachis hypogaea]
MARRVPFAAGAVVVSAAVPHMQPMMSYQVPPGKPAILNGYAAIAGSPQMAVPPAETRFKIFKENLRFIHEHNSTGNKPYKLGLNKFADITNEEYRARYHGTKPRNSFQQ